MGRAATTVILITASITAVAGCAGSDNEPPPASDRAVKTTATAVKTATPTVRPRRLAEFDQPVYAVSAPGEAGLFVVERAGRVMHWRPGSKAREFLDIRSRVGSDGQEQGLLSIAFHPDYARNGRLFVSYTNRDGDTRIDEYASRPSKGEDANGGAPKPARRQQILAVDQPFENHNGGLILFGPDEYLYFGLGDGGSVGDPQNRAQDRTDLLGKILRLDVNKKAQPYAVPADNPYAKKGGMRGEIWHYGLRNPWRFSFDSKTRDMWIGDVGQSEWEEIDRAGARTSGLNFGWDAREGSRLYDGGSRLIGSAALDPVVEYSHEDGCSVTGGYVYRGQRNASLQGWYIYADFCADWLRLFKVDQPGAGKTLELDGLEAVASFAQDAEDELYVVTLDGSLYALT